MVIVVSAAHLTQCLEAIASSRDRAAFIALFEYYAPRLRAYFLGRGVSVAKVDDLVQETMLRLWVKAASFDPMKGSPSAWVFTIARNLHLTALRDGHLALPEEDKSTFLADSAPTPDGLLAAHEVQSRLRHEIDKLPANQADVLRASFFEDRSHVQIARARNVPVGTVKSHLRRALIRLRPAITEAL
jgi:RNA polymerase sigma-70 factor (ECF subfamily)